MSFSLTNKKSAKDIFTVNKYDIILTAAVILFCLILLPFLLPKSAAGAVMQIYSDGVLFREVRISEDAIIEVEGKLTVVVSGKTVRVSGSDCPGGQCRNTPPIKNAGDTIICLPNRIIVKIVGERETDAVSG